MSRILLSGSSGFIGQGLSRFLFEQGHTLVHLVRSDLPSSSGRIHWNPEKGTLVKEEFEGFDAVIHLAGEPVFGRWTRAKKEKILYSRTVGTWLLSQMLSQLFRPPRLFLMASAVGFYGDRGETLLCEKSVAGQGFLASVCCEWEKATQALENRGVRVVKGRLGAVLGPEGGILKRLLPLYRLGLGGRLGSGSQWMSWIEQKDLERALLFICEQESIEGAVNLVSPSPMRQEDFSRELAQLLHRPRCGHLPAWLLHLVFGQASDELLMSSLRVEPRVLLEAGFTFRSPILTEALRKAIR